MADPTNQIEYPYVFSDPTTYPHQELLSNNPKTVDVLRLWFTELYLINSEADHSECDDDELERLNNIITLMIGHRLKMFVDLINPKTVPIPEPEPSYIKSVMNSALLMMGINGKSEEIDVKEDNEDNDVREIIDEVFSKILLCFNNGSVSGYGNKRDTIYNICVKICRKKSLALERMNIELWMNSTIESLENAPDGESDQIIERLGPAMVKDELVNKSDIGMVSVKSTMKQ